MIKLHSWWHLINLWLAGGQTWVRLTMFCCGGVMSSSSFVFMSDNGLNLPPRKYCPKYANEGKEQLEIYFFLCQTKVCLHSSWSGPFYRIQAIAAWYSNWNAIQCLDSLYKYSYFRINGFSHFSTKLKTVIGLFLSCELSA